MESEILRERERERERERYTVGGLLFSRREREMETELGNNNETRLEFK